MHVVQKKDKIDQNKTTVRKSKRPGEANIRVAAGVHRRLAIG